MPMRQSSVIEVVRDQLLPTWRNEHHRLEPIDVALRNQTDNSQLLPRGATKELKNLQAISKSPLLALVITTMSQGLFVDGYRSPDARENAEAWKTWAANDLETRQTAIHRAALSYGYSYMTVMPGMDHEGPRSVMRGVSPRKMTALYADPAEDDWPMLALRVERSADRYMLRMYDEECVYFLSTSSSFDEVEFIEYRDHDSGVCPVVRYSNLLDLDGRADGEVEQLIPLAARHDKTTYDRLVTQHYNSWKVRTIAGLSEFADSEEEANRKKLKLAQDDILVAEDPDTKFGTLDETPLDGFIKAAVHDLDTLSAVSQVPSTALSGKVANLSADAIAELRAGLTQKLFERKQSFGKSHAQGLRLAARQQGDESGWHDELARVTWADMSPATMGQIVDGLVKAVQSLGVPAQEVWHLIPGVSKPDVDDWKRAASRDTLLALAGAALPPTSPTTDDDAG